MNDEIKEILEHLDIVVNKPLPMLILAPEYTKILLDYITNLQQENEYLKKTNDEKTKIGIADHKYASQMEDKVIILQQENERLKETNVYCNRTDCVGRIKDSRKYDSVYQEKEDYKSRCEKAVEYIDRETGKGIYESGYGRGTAITICKEHLLNILQNGSDDNDK